MKILGDVYVCLCVPLFSRICVYVCLCVPLLAGDVYVCLCVPLFRRICVFLCLAGYVYVCAFLCLAVYVPLRRSIRHCPIPGCGAS